MVQGTRELSLMGRRRFLETLGAMGLSAEAVSHMTKEQLESLTDDPTDEVPRIGALRYPDAEKYAEPPFPKKPGEREPEYYTISRDRWVVVETAFDAAQRIQKQIDNIDSSGLVSAAVAIDRNGRAEEYSVVVKRQTVAPHSIHSSEGGIEGTPLRHRDDIQTADVTLDELMGVLPDTTHGTVGNDTVGIESRDNIPIEFVESITWDDECSEEDCEITDDSDKRVFTSQYRYYVGNEYHTGTGCHINIDPDGYDGKLTVGPRVQPVGGGDPTMLTSAHGAFYTESDEEDDDVEAEDPEDAIGRNVYQGGSGDFHKIGEIGEIKHHDGDPLNFWDVAIIEMGRPSGNIHAGNKLASDELPNTFSGELASSRVGQDYIKDGEGPICKQGWRTGRCEHTIRDYIPRTGSRPDEIELYRDNENGGGNSGAPYFAERDGNLDVAGMHNWGRSETVENPPWPPYEINIAAGIWIGDIEDMFGVQVV